jgi:hypothetical protein
MKREHMMWYVAALIAGAVTALALGAPASTVLVALVVLACPLMMMFMMGNMHGGGPRSGTGQDDSHPTRSDSN